MWGGGGSSWEQDMFLSGARRAPARHSGMSCCVPDTGRQGQSRNPDGGESEAQGSLREARNGSVSRREGTWEPGGLPSRVETRRRCLGDHGSVRQRSCRRGRRRGLRLGRDHMAPESHRYSPQIFSTLCQPAPAGQDTGARSHGMRRGGLGGPKRRCRHLPAVREREPARAPSAGPANTDSEGSSPGRTPRPPAQRKARGW